MEFEITVVGTGNWGTTLAIALARGGKKVALLARNAAEADVLRSAGENTRFLPGHSFPATLELLADPDRATRTQLLLLVTPSRTIRSNAEQLAPFIAPDTIVLSCAKGIEAGSLATMSEVIRSALPAVKPGYIGALSGPNIASEIAPKLPATTVVATSDSEAARVAQSLLTTTLFRVYRSADVTGVELAGALKNIIALGAGIGDGLGVGDNAKAAFITRGLAEITRLGVARGANPLTFAGLAGLGDLVATCASPYSRNRRLGEALARGQSLSEAQASLGQVAEGVGTTATARELAAQHNVELPIADEMYRVLFEGKSAHQAGIDLMQRDPKDELAGFGWMSGGTTT
jgi:glycerol-3-phosphate dehydrogenase (NAD(P)+)